jgi:aerobic-type carbon monoxide dehydrogenase small subunit (CoxS/CutS family)
MNEPATCLTIRVSVNGRAIEREVQVRTTLADFLRDELGLTATRLGCEHGVCGACTILVENVSVRSCLMLAVQADGAEVQTVEGLASNGEMSPTQRAFWEHHALQCGFCTSGFLMTAADLEAHRAGSDETEIREALSGNLCRCTGYANLVDAIAEVLRKQT